MPNVVTMNFIRKFVSGKRNRLRDGDFDLDLSYITPRIIAMSYPSDGLESVYRNSIHDVASFLNSKHADSYMVFNLSERRYDNALFGDRVVELGFPDHHAPPVEIAWTLCMTMHAWLQADPRHVAVVHCLAGKGRTGVIIACYMLFAGMVFKQSPKIADGVDANPFGPSSAAPPASQGAVRHPLFMLPSPTDLSKSALQVFRAARGEGVKNPSQERTVRYFARVVHAAIIAAHRTATGEEEEDDRDNEAVVDGSASRLGRKRGFPADEPAWVLWDATRTVRDLKALPLPVVATLKTTRVLVSGLPNLAQVTVAEVAFGAPPPSGATEPPVLCITTAPYQGANTKILFNSAWHERDSCVFSPAIEPGVQQGMQAGGGTAPAGSLGLAMYSLDSILRGDVLLTFRVGGVSGGPGKGIESGGSQEVFRASFHSSFVPAEGRSVGVYRLTKKDVDQGKRARAAFSLDERDFFVDIFYESVVATTESSLTDNDNDERHGAHASGHRRTSSLDTDDGGIFASVLANMPSVDNASGSGYDAGILASGWLLKRGQVMKTWKKRWCVLRKTGNAAPWAEAMDAIRGKQEQGRSSTAVAVLYYFKSPSHPQPKGILPLFASTLVTDVSGGSRGAGEGSARHAGASEGRARVFVLETLVPLLPAVGRSCSGGSTLASSSGVEPGSENIMSSFEQVPDSSRLPDLARHSSKVRGRGASGGLSATEGTGGEGSSGRPLYLQAGNDEEWDTWMEAFALALSSSGCATDGTTASVLEAGVSV